MPASIAQLATPTGVAMLNGLLNETLRLAADARAYLDEGQARCRHVVAGTSVGPLVEACELSRLSARLGFCVSWLLARRAVNEGELSSEQASQQRWRLDGHDICLSSSVDAAAALPPRLAELLQRSLGLYRRVARLDRSLDA